MKTWMRDELAREKKGLLNYHDIWSKVMAKAQDDYQADRIILGTKVKVGSRWMALETYNKNHQRFEHRITAYKLGKVL